MLESLLKVVAEVKQRTNGARRISLFLDFDGTMMPIESNPLRLAWGRERRKPSSRYRVGKARELEAGPGPGTNHR